MNDQLVQLLLQRFGGAEAVAAIPDLVSQLGAQDPRYATLAQLLAQRQASSSEQSDSLEVDGDEQGVIDAEPVVDALERQERRTSSKKLRRMMTSLYREVEELRTRNDTLAAALGACYLCWGKDTQCPICRGRGQPGAFGPDPALFAMYIAPALKGLATVAPNDVDHQGTSRLQTPAGDGLRDERRP
jgi:hypothetical protein